MIAGYKQLRVKHWSILLLFWGCVAVIISNQLYFNSIKNGLNPNWSSIFLDQLPIWFLWLLFTPLLIYLVNRFPFESDRWWRSTLIYLVTGGFILMLLSNVTLIYMFLIHGYLDLSTASFDQYLPYLISRISNDFLIYSLVMMILVLIRSYSIRKNHELNMALMSLRNNQLKNQLTQAQLQALKLQLNPHFLFNTLNTISSLIIVGEEQTSINMTSKLGDFLRRTLEMADHEMVPLAKELEFFNLYLEIESIRFRDKLELRQQIDDACLSTLVPNLILQPLIENAVKYGVSKKKEAKLIELSVRRTDDLLEVCLFNEGPLLSSENQGNGGIGLKNVKERLEKIYAKQFFFAMENDKLRNGVKVLLQVPLNYN